MQNDMRDRLVRLLRADMHTECDKHEDCLECPYQNDEDACYEHLATMCADHLIANGVILPPLTVGDMVDKWFSHNEIVAIWHDKKGENCHYLLWKGMGYTK